MISGCFIHGAGGRVNFTFLVVAWSDIHWFIWLFNTSNHQVRQKRTQDLVVTYWNLKYNYSNSNFPLFLYTYNVVQIFSFSILKIVYGLSWSEILSAYITSPWISLLGILLQIWSIRVLPFLVGLVTCCCNENLCRISLYLLVDSFTTVK